MLRRTALQLLALAPAWQHVPGSGSLQMRAEAQQPGGLVVHLEWTSIEVRRGKETVTIDPQELFDALRPRDDSGELERIRREGDGTFANPR